MKLRVKEICKERGIMMRELAEKINITEVGLSKSLNGNPSISRLEEVAGALDVTVSELLDEGNQGNSIVCPNCGSRVKIQVIQPK